MKTYKRNPDEHALVLDPAEWEALCAAVEVAFDDVDSIPSEYAEAAGRLWAGTHEDVRGAAQSLADEEDARAAALSQDQQDVMTRGGL